MNCCNDDEEYQSCEVEEGMSSCKDVASSSVLGKRSVFLKEYGSSKNNPSSFKQLQALDSDVIILQHQIGEQAKALAELSKTLTKHTRTMAVLQDIVRVLAVPTDIVELIEMSNNEEGASDKRRDAGSIGLSKASSTGGGKFYGYGSDEFCGVDLRSVAAAIDAMVVILVVAS
ncbi:hypothetical protein RHMOL_Rhmol11G0214000 [Rhododendron molle]|uniref:Uncharacterized protein n=1 Tax=Rhododendron molle TaxID=49168 RepID=A0ACC0LUP7_RHOML|nr:hypothetical protein RHMOL_Rhmol11G0214000 [Rhododendron molle]